MMKKEGIVSGRKEEKAVFINGRQVVGAIRAAQILTERAKQMGYDRKYSRDTIYRHFISGKLVPAAETPAGNLYYVEDIESLPISPQVGKRGKHTSEEAA